MQGQDWDPSLWVSGSRLPIAALINTFQKGMIGIRDEEAANETPNTWQVSLG